MKSWRGVLGGKGLLAFSALLLACCLLLPGPAQANQLGSQLEVTAVPIASAAVLALGGYMLWKNRLSQPPDAVGKLGYHGPGEFYVGVYAGGSFVPNMDWDNKKQTSIPYSVTVNNINVNPGPAAGIKVGYFLDSCPYLGFEGEGSIASDNIPSQTVTISPSVSGTKFATLPQQNMLIWTMALHIVGRYGFFKDKEVPFGRLQPYIGIGPNVGVLYFQNDSAKNFSLDTELGVRYMFSKHLAVFVEYKFFYQWDVQLGTQTVNINGTRYNLGNLGWEGKQTHFDFDNHKLVVGVEYHF